MEWKPLKWLRSLSAPTVTVTRETRPMTDAEREAFDQAFAHFDKGFRILQDATPPENQHG